jgi:hypothetical protein
VYALKPTDLVSAGPCVRSMIHKYFFYFFSIFDFVSLKEVKFNVFRVLQVGVL